MRDRTSNLPSLLRFSLVTSFLGPMLVHRRTNRVRRACTRFARADLARALLARAES